MSQTFLLQAVIYLLAAVVAVPIAKRAGLGSVLGYLIAGVLIGPSALGLVGAVEDVQHFAEFGVVIMLFVVGLELRPSLLWRLRGPILGMGGIQVVATQPLLVSGLVLSLVVLKFLLLAGIGLGFRMGWAATLLFACALAQGGEFCFVLISMAGQLQLFPDAVAQPLKAAIAISMALTPLLLVFNDRVLQPRFAANSRSDERPHDEIESHDHPVILAGFGRFGHIVGRLLRANGFGVTVLDNDPDQVETLAKFGIKSYYGDASRADLLAAAGAANARLFICADLKLPPHATRP